MDAVLQPRQLVHSPVVQHGHVGDLCHLRRLHDQPLAHILALALPQHHLVQRRRILPDAPLQLVHLPAVPRFLHPLLGHPLRNGDLLIPLLACHLGGQCVPLRLLLLPGLGLPLVLFLPFHDLVFLHDQAVLGLVRTPLLVPHLPGKVGVLAPQLPHLQPCLVPHLLQFGPHPLAFGFPFPLVGLPQHGQLLVQIAHVAHVHAQQFQVRVQLLFRFRVPLLQLAHMLHLGVPARCALVLGQPPVEFPALHLLHAPQALFHLGRPRRVSGSRLRRFQVVPLDALKNSLGIGQLGQLHDIPDDPAR